MERSKTYRDCLLATFTGVLLSRICQPLLFPIEIGVFSIDFGHISLFILVIAGTLLYGGISTLIFWASLASSLDQITYLITKNSLGFYSFTSMVGSAILLVLSTLGFTLLFWSLHTPYRSFSPLKLRMRSLFILILFLVGGGFRLFQIWMLSKGIPNEARSLFIGNFEIHHINHGVIIIWISALLLHYPNSYRAIELISLLLLATGIALITDELIYYALKEITDEAYLSPVSTLGAILVPLVSVGILFVLPNKHSEAR